MTTAKEISRWKIYAYNGVFEQEQKVGNLFEVTLRVEYPFLNAMESDNLNDTASYARLCELIEAEMKIPSKLLEAVAGRIIKSIKREFSQISGGVLKISKLKPPITAEMESVSVIVNW